MLNRNRHFFISTLLILCLGLMAQTYLDSFIQTLSLFVLINVLLALSLNLLSGKTGLFSLGHAGFMAIGAYSSALLSKQLFLPWMPGEFWSFPIFAFFGGTCAAFCGWIVGQPTLRLKGDYLAVVTLGFGEIVRVFALNLDVVGGARGLNDIPTPLDFALFGFSISSFLIQFIHAAFWAYICLLLFTRLGQSRFGRELVATREDELAAQSLGVNVTRAKVRSFALSAFFAGVAGSLFAHLATYISPTSFGFSRSIDAVMMVVLGGLGSFSGSVAAALIITILPEILRPLQELTGVDLRMVIYSLLLILLMVLRPQGAFGSKELPEVISAFLSRWRNRGNKPAQV